MNIIITKHKINGEEKKNKIEEKKHIINIFGKRAKILNQIFSFHLLILFKGDNLNRRSKFKNKHQRYPLNSKISKIKLSNFTSAK